LHVTSFVTVVIIVVTIVVTNTCSIRDPKMEKVLRVAMCRKAY
jgi:hypothetical protein